jgi:hypothetical protein
MTREYNVSETGSVFPTSGVGGETPTLLGPFERANLNSLQAMGERHLLCWVP